jgi:rod shape-determining protein MreC
MFDLLWRYRKQIVVVALFGLAIYVVLLRDKDEDDYNLLDHAIVKITAPLQSLLATIGDSLGDNFEIYVANKNAAAQNEALRAELYETRRKLQAVDDVRRENHRLLELLALTDRSKDVTYLPARVIANSTAAQFRSIRIDQGSEDGVQRGMGVIGEAGLVGRVLGVEKHYADVMLLSDAASSIDIVVGRTRARGRLRGLGEATRFRARIDYLVRSAAVEVGDSVLTTGAGRVFPKGILVGYVQSVDRVAHGLYQEAIIEPPVSLFALDEVLVVIGFGPEAVVETVKELPAGEQEQPSSMEMDPENLEVDLLWAPD